MGIGVISLTTSQKREPSGSPFTSDSAHNGTSVDAAGKIVLGNDVGDPLSPAALISDREIIMDDGATGFLIQLNSIVNAAISRLTGDTIVIQGEDFTAPLMAVEGGEGANSIVRAVSGDDGSASLIAQTGNFGLPLVRMNSNNTDIFDISTGFGVSTFTVNLSTTVISIDNNSFYTQVSGGTPAAFNTAALQVQGTVTKRLFPQSQGAGTYNINRDLDSAKVFSNTGAVTLALPNMVGSNNRPGFYFDVNVSNVAGITIDADAGVTIRYGGLATSTGGTIASTEVGAFIRIMLLDSTTWVTCFSIGLWSLT